MILCTYNWHLLTRKDVNAYVQLFISYPVKQEVCESFNPLNSTHMDAVGDCKSRKRCKKSATTLAHLLQVRKYQILAIYFLVQVILNFIFSLKCRNFIPNYVYLDYLGDNIEICTPKEGDRFWGVFSGSSSGSNSKSKTNSGGNSASQILAIGATAAQAFSLFG